MTGIPKDPLDPQVRIERASSRAPARPAAVVAPLVERIRHGQVMRVALLGGDAGERCFFAQRLADELGLELRHVDVPRLLERTPKKALADWTAARRAGGLPLLEGAETLFAKSGEPRPTTRRIGANAAQVLQALARRKRPAILAAGHDTESRLLAVRACCEAAVDLGSGSEPRGRELPHTGQSFRVVLGGVELACSHVGPIVSADGAGPAATSGSVETESGAYHRLVLRRAAGADDRLFAWRQSVAAGCVDRRDVHVQLLDRPGGEPVVTWSLCAAWPVRWSGPTLDALEPRIAEEEIELHFESIVWTPAAGPRQSPEE